MLRIGKIEPSSSNQNRLAEYLILAKGPLCCNHNGLVCHKDTWWCMTCANPPAFRPEPESLALADQFDPVLRVAVDSFEPDSRTESAICTEFSKSFVGHRLQLFENARKPRGKVQRSQS